MTVRFDFTPVMPSRTSTSQGTAGGSPWMSAVPSSPENAPPPMRLRK